MADGVVHEDYCGYPDDCNCLKRSERKQTPCMSRHFGNEGKPRPPVEWAITYGCENEHVITTEVCDPCATSLTDGEQRCGKCFRAMVVWALVALSRPLPRGQEQMPDDPQRRPVARGALGETKGEAHAGDRAVPGNAAHRRAASDRGAGAGPARRGGTEGRGDQGDGRAVLRLPEGLTDVSGSAYPGPLTAQPKGREQVASLTCRHCGQRIAHGQVTGWYHDRTGLRDCLLEAEPPESATARRQA